MEEVVKKFLSVGYDDGYGDGYGSGYGDGYGYGYGYGSGYGYGDGYGYGYGYGDGNGSGSGYGDGSGDGSGYDIKSYNGQVVYLIDNVQTIIYSVHGNVAQGAILNSDLSLTDCYIAKYNNSFAHGDSAHKAMQDAINKAMRDVPVEERIKAVTDRYKDIDMSIEHSELFSLHNMLTGSCLMGRTQFAREHGLDPEHGSMTMREFIDLTKDAYGGDVIRQLAEAYNITL